MNHLLIAPLFLVLGSVVTYFIMAAKFDEKQSDLYERYLRMMESRDDLAIRNCHLYKENESLREINCSFLARRNHERELSNKILEVFYNEEKEECQD